MNIIIILLFAFVTNSKGLLNDKDGTMDIDKSLFLKGYNMYEIPQEKNDQGINSGYGKIDVYFNPLTISSLSPKNMEFSMDMFIGAAWQEPRYNYSLLTSMTQDNYFKFSKHLIDKMWLPSIYFENCKGCVGLLLFDPDHIYVFYDQLRNQTYASRRQLFSFTCHFNLQYYPFDSQTCSVKVITNGPEYKSYHFGFWPLFRQDDVNVPTEFHLSKITSNECVNTLSPVNSKCYLYNFVFQRLTARYIWKTYVPSVLIVIISWMSFWVDPEMVAPRVTLGLTSMLTLVTHFTAALRDLPAEPKQMAIDIWSGACIIIVFMSIMEFSLVVYIYYHSNSNNPNINCTEMTDTLAKRFLKKLFQKSTAKLIDRISQIIFPLGFVIFNVVYWIYYIVAVTESNL